MPGYRGVLAWQKAMDVATDVYRMSCEWPKEELYGPTNQLRRAAVSVPANIAEGKGRGGSAEYSRFLAIAYGSLCELETHLYLAQRLDYLKQPALDALVARTTEVEVAKLLHGLMKSQRSQPGGKDAVRPNA